MNELRQEFARQLEELRRKNAERKKPVLNHAYFSWLEGFSKNRDWFRTDWWLYKPQELSDEDNAGVQKIELFFEVLVDYCHKYHVNIACNEQYFNTRVNAKYNGVGYQLGQVYSDNGFCVFVKRMEPAENAIDLEDVLNDVPPADFEVKEAVLEKFEHLVTSMKAMGIPAYTLKRIIEKK